VPTKASVRDGQDFLVVCCFAAIGLAASLGLAVALQPSPDLIILLAQLGG
jgi:hypothetical protein